MKRFRPDGRHDRPNPRALRVAFGITAVGAALLLAACSSSSSSTTPSTSTSASTSAAPSTAPASNASTTGPDIAALQADITKAAATPSFSDYGPSYGGKVPSIANLAGKKIMIIPGVSALAACEEIAQAASNFAKAAGMVPTIFNNLGTTADTNSAIENAIHERIRGDRHGVCDGPVAERAGDRPGPEGRHRGGHLRRNAKHGPARRDHVQHR